MTDPLSDIKQYSPTLKIDQVLKFCEKKQIPITRAMIQNYIRDGLLPPPVNKRVYTHKHLAAIAIISRLKTVFEIPQIKEALTPYMDNEGLPLGIYEILTQKTNNLTAEWQQAASPTLSTEPDKGLLLTMNCAAQLKQLAEN